VVDRSYPVGADTAIVLGKSETHQLIDKPHKALVVFVIYFSDNISECNVRLLEPLLDMRRPIVVAAQRGQQVRRALRQMLHEQDSRPVEWETAMAQCLSSILLSVCRAACAPGETDTPTPQKSASRVADVLDYICAHYYEPHTLAGAARMAELSQRQFSNVCRKLTGRSFIQFVNSLRADRAVELLLEHRDMPVTATAFAVGFEELSTFYRAFRKHKGVSPRTFRDRSIQ